MTVRFSQVIAISITVISQDEVKQSLIVLYKGFDKTAELHCVSWTHWLVSVALRFVNGIFGIAVTFMLIMRADTVRDLLLNFTAVEFISNVDDIMFAIAKYGWLWDRIKKDAKTGHIVKRLQSS